MRIFIALVAHPRRQELIFQLAAQSMPDAICWDTGGRGAGHNHLAAWNWLSECPRPGWGVVLEDDVVLAPNFREQLVAAIDRSPTDILSLYLGRGRPVGAQELIGRHITADVSYYTHRALFSAQGYAMPLHYFRDSSAVAKRLRATIPIDLAISRWARRDQEMPVSYCRHSLVDHRDGLTLIENHGDGQLRNSTTALITPDSFGGEQYPEVRKAWLFAGPQVDWTRGSVAL